MSTDVDQNAQAELDEGRLARITEHAKYELAQDWDGALSTMTEEGHYVVYPNRLRISGDEAIKQMWTRTVPTRCLNYENGRKVVGKEVFVNENAVVDVIYHNFPDDQGETVESTFIAMFHFDGTKIISETMFYDQAMTQYLDVVLESPEFLALPGVERI